MAQAIVKTPGLVPNTPRPAPVLPSDVVTRLYQRAEKFSTLHAMACTCKGWNAASEPIFTSLRKLAFDYSSGIPNLEPDTFFLSGQAPNFALAYLVSRIYNHDLEELPEHVIQLSCSFANFLAQNPVNRTVNLVQYISVLRGLNKDRWEKLMNFLDDPDEKVLLRLAASSCPQAPLMFHPKILAGEQAQSALDLIDGFRNKKLVRLVTLAYDWAKKYGATDLPEALFHALPRANFTYCWANCRDKFTEETIISLLKQPLSDDQRSALMDTLLGPIYPNIADLVRDLPPGSEPEILNLVHAWLSKLPIGYEADVLKHLTKRIKINKFDLSNAQTQLILLVIEACARKTVKCQHAELFLKTLVEQGILSDKELKLARKAAKQST